MQNHPRILQQRVEVVPFWGGRQETCEWVGGEEDQCEEAECNQAQDAKDACAQGGWKGVGT